MTLDHQRQHLHLQEEHLNPGGASEEDEEGGSPTSGPAASSPLRSLFHRLCVALVGAIRWFPVLFILAVFFWDGSRRAALDFPYFYIVPRHIYLGFTSCYFLKIGQFMM